MALWQVNALKYDLSQHYSWPATLVALNGNHVHLSSQMGGLLRHYTRNFEQLITRRSELHFWRDRWYNIFINYTAEGTLGNYYCNVSLPPTITADSVTFVDLDLDVRIWPDGRCEVLDQEEFELYCLDYGYPAWVQRSARQAVNDVIRLYENRQFPFDSLA
jgi:protein associated with RNAse G/E